MLDTIGTSTKGTPHDTMDRTSIKSIKT